MPQTGKRKPKRHWKDVAEEACGHRAATAKGIPDLPQIDVDNLPTNVLDLPKQLLSDEDFRITELLPEGLVERLASGKLTAVAVATAFLRRAYIAQQLTNCITEFLPERAFARARYLDDHYAKHHKPIGPLHGLPISVKEHIGVEGLRMHGSFVALWDNMAKEDALVLQSLWRAGAVFYVRTTQPQSMMHLETNSNLYGLTVSPWNRELSPGGSSGGEGALIALKGSCLGIGTDVGGSIRSPAANNGLYGLKPTAMRVPTDGWSSIAAAVDEIPTAVGPLSSSFEGIKLFMKTVLAAKPWLVEPALSAMPWNPTVMDPQQRLKIAVMWHDGVVRPHPPITRALYELVSRIGHIPNVSVVDWKAHLHDEAWAITSSLYYTDGGVGDIELMESSGEPLLPLTKWIIQDNPCVKKLSLGELQYWAEEREAYRKEYAKLWNSTADGVDELTGEMRGTVDAILCPAGPGVAPRHNTSKYWGYTAQWNLLDYPGLVFPVTQVDPTLDTVDHTFKPITDKDQENWELYDPDMMAGLPVSLQLICRRFEDEKLLAILDHIRQHVTLPFKG